LFAGIVTPGGRLEASGSNAEAPRAVGQSVLTLGWANGEPTLRAEGRGVKFFKQVGKQRVAIRVEVPGDRIEVEADAAGVVRVGRNGRFLRFQMNDDFAASIALVQELTAGSRALAGLEGLVATIESNPQQEARAVMTSYALLHAIRGSAAPSRAMANAVKPPTSPIAMRASSRKDESPAACWAEFAVTMNEYLTQFNECIETYWWIPGWTATCAFQFAVQAELAWFWTLSCSGGMPV